MIHSMTGFGNATFQVQGWSFELEVRSVNHRHLDVRVRLPRGIASLEPELRARVQERFARGKVDLSVTAPEGGTPSPHLELDLEVARAYLAAAGTLAESDGVRGPLDVAALLALPGVARLSEPRLEGETLREPLFAAAEQALEALAAMRAAEGAALERDLAQRLDRVGELAVQIEGRAGEVQESARERLRKRARQLEAETGLLDEARLHQEITLAADRMDITEELVRLHSHVDQFRKQLGSAGPDQPVGRRLDFLLQELGRETNTIGSKASDAPVAHWIVEMKAELERLREQVQNIE